MSVTVNGTSGLVFGDGTIQGTAAGNGFRNKVMNGDFRVDQRNLGTAYTGVVNGAYTLDRFIHYHTVGTTNIQQNQGSVTPPAGYQKYLGLTVATAGTSGSTDYYNIQHHIEGNNISDLAWGTSAAKAVTLSFWVNASVTGSYSASILESGSGSYSYCFSYTINSANTWEFKTVTIPGPTVGSWPTGTGRGIGIIWDLGNGSSMRTGTPNTWLSGNWQGVTGAVSLSQTVNATFKITGVQFEVGSAATQFEARPYATELALCQRYYYQAGAFFGGYTITVGQGLSAGSTNVWRVAFPIPVPLRATPTISRTNMSVWSSGFGSTALNAIGTIYYLTGQIYLEVDLTSTANHGITAGYPVYIQTNGSGGKSTIEMNAEL